MDKSCLGNRAKHIAAKLSIRYIKMCKGSDARLFSGNSIEASRLELYVVARSSCLRVAHAPHDYSCQLRLPNAGGSS